MANNSQPVTLRASAEQAAPDLGTDFGFALTNAPGLSWNGEPIDIVPAQAQDHVPIDVPPEAGLGLSIGLTETIPAQADDHVPSGVPPDNLPQPALDNLSTAPGRDLTSDAICEVVTVWRQLFIVVLVACFFIVAGNAAASEAQFPPNANLPTVDVSTYPWSSIAKLNNSVGGSCTAAVVEQAKILTAAHCLFNRRTGRFLPPSALHVLLEYERGRFALHALVSNYTIGSGYDPQQSTRTISFDWAILTLAEPLPDGIRPLRVVDRVPAAGSHLMLGSYAQRRLHIMTADENCQLLEQLPESFLLAHDCQVAPGSSGAPLLLMEGEVASIIGVQVAIGRRNGTDVMLAVSGPSIAERQLH